MYVFVCVCVRGRGGGGVACVCTHACAFGIGHIITFQTYQALTSYTSIKNFRV